MRFYEPVGVIRWNDSQVESNSQFVINKSASEQVRSERILENENFSSENCFQTIKSLIHEKKSEVGVKNTKTNNFDSHDVDVNCVTSLETFLKQKSDNCGYFKNFLDIDSKRDSNGNGVDDVILIETLNLTEGLPKVSFEILKRKTFVRVNSS